MLAKQVLGYIPSLLIPAITSFGAIYFYTRLLSTSEFGHYALTLSTMTLLNAVFFYWLQTSLPRLMPQAAKAGSGEQLRITTYLAFAGMTGALLLIALLTLTTAPLGNLKEMAALAVPLALARSLLNINQAIHLSRMDYKRYNIIECGQSLIGFIAGIALVYFFGMGNVGAILGMIFGMTLMAIFDGKMLRGISWKGFDREALRELVRFGVPLIFSFGLGFLISSSDRFIIEHFRDAGEVGIYAAGYSLMDRITVMIFMIVATPSFPLTVNKLEHEGIEAARQQTYANGVAIFALILPACAGLILTTEQLAAFLIGAEFRSGAVEVMPWIAVSAMLNGLSVHYFSHALHLAKKPALLVVAQLPSAIVNLGLNFTLIPEYGYMGAVYATMASYLLLLILTIVIGQRAFPYRFPFLPLLQIMCCVAAMAAVLKLVSFPISVIGLAAEVISGGVVYGAGLLLFNVMDIRPRVRKILARFI